jgi:hypothetical protein
MASTVRMSGNVDLFVRVAAVGAALVNLVLVIPWGGGLEVLAGDGASLWDAAPSAVLALVSGIATAQIVLRKADLPGRNFGHRYRVVVASFCLGGAIMGGLLVWLWALDGTFGAGTFADVFARGPLFALAAFASALAYGPMGVMFGLVIGLAEGAVIAFPLAAMLGSCGDAR